MSCPKLKRCTAFKKSWLDMEDAEGRLAKNWLREGKENGFGYCFVCQKNINIKCGGFTRLKDHSKTVEHQRNVAEVEKIPKLNFWVAQTSKPVNKMADKVLNAEIRWCLLTANNDLPFVLSDSVSNTFKEMFEDSEIAQNMKLKRQKATYITSFGVAKYINEDLLKPQLQTSPYSIMIDEGSINYSRKWLAILVRHFVDAAIHSDFLSIQALGDASASTLVAAIKKELCVRGIPLRNCVGVMSDSANVMRGTKGGVIALLQKENEKIIDVGGCAMHHVHNSVQKAMGTFTEIEETLDEIFFYLRYAKAANAFRGIEKFLHLKELKFLRRVESRWLQIFQVTERFIELYDALRTFFSALPMNEQNKERVQKIRKFLDSPDSLVYLKFVLFALKPLKEFETFFQSSKPVIHMLYGHMISVIGDVCRSFIRQQHVDEVLQFKTKRLDEISPEHQVADKDLLIGSDTRRALRSDHISAVQRALFFKRVRSFYNQLLKSLIHYLPIGHRLLRSIQCLDPAKKENVSEEDVVYLMNSFAVKGDVDQLRLEWRQYCSDDSFLVSENVASFWNAIRNSKKFELLSSIAERAIILPHGNACTERLFSSLKSILTADRNSLQDPSLNGLLTVKSYLLSRGQNSATFQIDDALRQRCYDACSCYKQFLKDKEKEREEESAKREFERQIKEKAEAAEKEKKQQLDQAKELADKKRQLAMDYMETAKKLMEEAKCLSVVRSDEVSSKKRKLSYSANSTSKAKATSNISGNSASTSDIQTLMTSKTKATSNISGESTAPKKRLTIEEYYS